MGRLERLATGGWQFRFEDAYLADARRPVLGQTFEDDPGRPRRARSRLPAFFSNLLPEGALRALVALQAERKLSHEDSSGRDEPEILARLGRDLPGAVIVALEDGAAVEDPAAARQEDERSESPAPPWKFSLAGVQLKFSPVREGRRLTVPVGGVGGDWILKLPSPAHPALPANELSMLLWARASGIEVPPCELVDLGQVTGLPVLPEWKETEAFLIRRFDREGHGRRIHQEDFAQVLSIYPERKYRGPNYETLARIVLAVCGEPELRAFIDRLVFVVFSGNGDAHLKNWSLLYPDGRRAVLSPAYDFVFTRAYLPSDTLALNLGGSKSFEEVTLATFRRLGQKIGFDEQQVEDWARQAAGRTRTAWTAVRGEVPMPGEMREKLERHLAAVRL